MEEKREDVSDVVQKEFEEKMECDEVPSGSESAGKTDSSDRPIGTDDVSTQSPEASDSTSGIGTGLATTSPSRTPSAAETPAEVAPVPDQTTATTSPSRTPSVAETPAEVTPVPDQTAESTSAPIPSGTSTPLSPPRKQNPLTTLWKKIKSPGKKEKGDESATGAKAKIKSPGKKEKGDESATVAKAKIKSPGKKEKSNESATGAKAKSHLEKMVSEMRMSSPGKSAEPATGSDRSQPVEGASAVPDDKDDTFKKGGEKKGIGSKIRKSLSGILGKKSSSAETEGLVANQEESGAATTAPTAKPKDDKDNQPVDVPLSENPNVKIVAWTEGRQSLTERPSLTETQMTDIPSTFSGSVLMPPDEAKSSADENTSAGSAADSLVSSPDERIPEIQSDESAQNIAAEEQADVAAEMESSSSPESKVPEEDEGNEEPKPDA